MKDLRRGLWLMAIGITLLVAAQSFAEVNAGNTTTDVKGCLFKYSSTSGQVRPTPFIKTGDKEYGDENGNPEIWGYRVDESFGQHESAPDESGKIKPINVRADLFVPADGKFHEIPTGTTTRKVKCSCWEQQATQNASR